MKFEVDTNQVSRTVTQMTELIQKIADEKTHMMNEINTLNGMWVGEAHDVFVAQAQTDDNQMQEFIQHLYRIAERFDQAKIAYETCERSAVETIAAISI